MQIESEYKSIVKVPAGADTGRIIHDAMLVERLDNNNGVLVASDGFMLAAVPCKLDEDDIAGLVSAEALIRAFKATPRTMSFACLQLEAAAVVVPLDGRSTWPRSEGAYPDYHKIVPREPLSRSGGIVAPIGMQLLQRAWEAVGKPHLGNYWLQYNRDSAGPVVLHTRAPLPNGAPALPYACIMPTSAPSWVPRWQPMEHVA